MTDACYNCKYQVSIPRDCHLSCRNSFALVRGSDHGISNGWFFHPYNFDPVWLEYCDGFEKE